MLLPSPLEKVSRSMFFGIYQLSTTLLLPSTRSSDTQIQLRVNTRIASTNHQGQTPCNDRDKPQHLEEGLTEGGGESRATLSDLRGSRVIFTLWTFDICLSRTFLC